MKTPDFIRVFLEKWLFWDKKWHLWFKKWHFQRKKWHKGKMCITCVIECLVSIFLPCCVLLFRLRVAVGKIPYMILKACVYK